MQSALVLRDAVMLHDTIRTHTRATIVVVVPASHGMILFVVYDLISPKPSLTDAVQLVGSQEELPQWGALLPCPAQPEAAEPGHRQHRLLGLGRRRHQRPRHRAG